MKRVKMYDVYSQEKPIATGEKVKVRDPKGQVMEVEWHRPNFKFVGKAATFADAKKLCKHPVMEAPSV